MADKPDPFVLTTQTRLTLPADADAVLVRFGADYGRLKRLLYAEVARSGGKAVDCKTAFCARHAISSRLFNALRVDVQGMIDSVTELLGAKQKDLLQNEKALHGRIKSIDRELRKLRGKEAADKTAKTKNRYLRLTLQRKKAVARLAKVKHRIAGVTARLKANVPGIGFGSRKLFRKQFNLKENGYASHDEWRADWRAARDHQIHFLGSRDEAGGCQQCTLSLGEGDTFNLRIRIPDTQLRAGEDKYLVVTGLKFPYQGTELRAALARNQALSWTLHRDARGWRALVSFSRPLAPVVTLAAKYGALGVDFNEDHLAVTEVDAHGNLVHTWRFNFRAKKDATSGQRKHLLLTALHEVLKLALEKKLPIVAEELDFQRKKKDMSAMSAVRSRKLSSLAYSQYGQLLHSKCARMGVELIRVNPAYTSVQGRVKYAANRGMSVHSAAAGVIARRGMGLKERLPQLGEFKVPSQGTTLDVPVPARKAGVKGCVTWPVFNQTLGKLLREHALATRKWYRSDHRVGASSGVQLAGTAAGRGLPRNRLAETTVISAAMILDDQVCTI